VDGIGLLSRNLGISISRLYRWVDDAIEKNDTMAIEVMKRRDRQLIHDIYKVAKYLGEKNMCVEDLLQTPGYRVEMVYDNIAYGAAKGGHKDLVVEMVRRGADEWNCMAMCAAKYGRKELLLLSIQIGKMWCTIDWNSIVSNATEGGYRDMVMDITPQ